MTDTPRLIEYAFPLKQASLDSVHEKRCHAGHIKAVHVWPARRPLAACRAALIATLLPDPGTPEDRQKLCEKIGGKVVQKIEKKRMPNGRVVERVKEETDGGILHWKRETENADVVEWFRQEIRKAYGGRAPRVLDPFAGGGAIPLEAMRLGCEVTAVDINPVAWFILKCTLEYPQKLAGKTRPLPDFILENEDFMEAFYKAHPPACRAAKRRGAGRHLVGKAKKTKRQKLEEKTSPGLFGQPDPACALHAGKSDRVPEADLAWHVRAWGQWVLERARRELAKFYPTYADFLPASDFQPPAQTSLPAYLPIPNRSGVFFVYVLKCADGSFYIGLTDNLYRRFDQHTRGEVSWTASRQPVKLVHWEEFATRYEAAEREKELKTGFGRKWIKREYEAKRLRAQLYQPRLVPLKEDGTPDVELLNREFRDPFASRVHNWNHNKGKSPACATERGEVAGRWVAKPTVAYLWARTVQCKNCRAAVPLLKSKWLFKKDKKRVLLAMKSNADETGVAFDVQNDVPEKGGNAAQKREHDRRIGAGTMSRSGAKCPCCGTIMTMEDLRTAGKSGRLGSMPTAVVVDGKKGKEYRLPTEHEIKMAEEAGKHIDEVFAEIPFGVPDEPTPKGGGSGAGRAFSVQGYGLMKWRDLFTPRQLLALGVFLKYTRAARDEMAALRYPSEWVEAVTAYLACVCDKIADYNSSFVAWQPGGGKGANTFQRWALPMKWDFCENNILDSDSGGWDAVLNWVTAPIAGSLHSAAKDALPPHVLINSATNITTKADIIVTDPPYYDAIPYSDCMDFFYVWLRRILNGLSVGIDSAFNEPLSPKWDHEKNDGELIDDESRHDGNAEKSKAIYEDGMFRAFKACHNALTSDGRLVIVFAHKEPDAWETLVSAVIRAGFVVDGSWPIQTEMGNRSRAMGSAALASSVWLVCKKRPATARPGWDNKVLEEMRANITTRLRGFWDAGIRGPDFVWAATGPALEAYSKHPVVKKANAPGQIMTVGEFLTHVRRIVVDFVVGRMLTGDLSACDAQAGGSDADAAADRLDAPTAYYLLHRHDFGLNEAPSGACILYAVSCGLSDRDLETTWNILARTGGKSSGNGDEDAVPDPDADTETARESGSKVKLKTWAQRKHKSMGYEAPGGQPVPLIDRIHRLMHLWKAGDVHKVDEYLDDHGLRRHELFKRLLQSLIELSRKDGASQELQILESLSNHVQAKGAVRMQPKSLFDEEDI